MLRRLGTTARLMQTTAHPDDEDGGMLTYESRGQGASVVLLTLNRGEGGQNKLGSGFSDGLGVLRTLELLAADQYYGVQQRFTRAADFGFSKTADETFQKWGGHQPVLADIVRVIRSDRPDVVVARFSGTERDGHGNHQASALLTKEAFRAAADPKQFPEQIAHGLLPWQARKLYLGNVCDFGAQTCPDANWTLKINSGVSSSDLGTSYVQFAMKGLRHQMSQGAASWNVEPGDRFTFYKLVDSVEPPVLDKVGHEKNFFDGLQTTLPALADRFVTDKETIPTLRQELGVVQALVAKASSEAESSPSRAVPTLSRIGDQMRRMIAEVRRSNLTVENKAGLLQALEEKLEQAQIALSLSLDLGLDAEVSPAEGAYSRIPQEGEARTTVSPGDEFLVTLTLHNGSSRAVHFQRATLELPAGWKSASDSKGPANVAAGAELRLIFRVEVPQAAQFTRPYWHRDNPDVEGVNHIDNEADATLPFSESHLGARLEYSLLGNEGATQRGEIATLIVAPFRTGSSAGVTARPLAVVPAFSVDLEPSTLVINSLEASSPSVKVAVTSNESRSAGGVLKLELPDGWRSEPGQFAVESFRRGEKKEFTFTLFPSDPREGRSAIRAVFRSAETEYREGYSRVTRDDLGSFYYFQPASLRVSTVTVILPKGVSVGYVMGAGDDILAVLKQLGMNVRLIPADKLETEDLSQFGTIVLGIRAYDTQKAVVAANKRLLDWTAAGGTLIVQYNAGALDFNAGHFTPYPATLSRVRVSVEEATVEVLAPEDGLFHFPNAIAASDFDGWVQERGLYFMDKWDDHFQPLLSCHDPGEDGQKGGLLRAQYGKGTYIYSGYAFFRQLPAGVPGAARLFVNLLSAGHDRP